ncbi:hypothetical protein HYZ97_04850 [Candidatus Pacearchaeota archaeon]|nr:hypothetical protein [Candidatus Pacearchaeota archaeon]
MPGFLDYLRQRKPVQPTQPPAYTPNSYGQQVGDYSPALGRNITATDLQTPQGSEEHRIASMNAAIAADPQGETMIRAAYTPEAYYGSFTASNAYNQQLEQQRLAYAGGQPYIGPSGGALNPNTNLNPEVPPRTDRPLDIYNPGPYLADILRKQLPGYVFGTKVPTPQQITLSKFLRLLPTQREQVLPAYVSALGIDPTDFFSEVQKYWLTGSPYRRTAWMS